ncbi:MAG: tetratricopeptide repeat protein [bacterium]|nr:tetratricopeptide repeat protein [bacterium]
MKKTLLILMLFSSIILFCAEWSTMTRTQKMDYLKELMNSKKYSDLVKYGEMLIAEGKPKKIDFNYAETFNLTAIGYKNTGNYPKAEEYYKKAAGIHKDDLFNKENYGLIMKNLGMLYYDQSKYSEMITAYRGAMEAFEDIDFSFGENDANIALCAYWLGYGYNNLSKYDSAMVYGEKALELDRKQAGEYSVEVGTDYLVLANAYSGKYDKENAKKYYKKSISVLEYLDVGYTELLELGVSYNDYGIFFAKNYEYDSAIYYYNEAIEVFKDNDDELQSAVTYGNLGNAYSYKYNYEDAANYYEKAYKIYKKEYGEYDSRTTKAKKNYDDMKSKTSYSSSYYTDDDDDNSSSYAYTPKKKSLLSNFDGCLDIIEDKPFSFMLAGDYMHSSGRYFVGGGLGLFSKGAGLSVYYYWSPSKEYGTTSRYLPLVYSVGYYGFSYEFSLDIPSLFDDSYSKNKSAPKPYAFGFGAGFKLFKLIQVKTQYIWGPGGYLPRGLSLNAGIEFFI